MTDRPSLWQHPGNPGEMPMRLGRMMLVLLACGAAAFDSPPPPSAAASAYLDRAIEMIRTHHRNAPGADWPKIIARAHAAIAGANAPSDTYSAIRGVLDTLGERHSFLIDAAQAKTPAPPPRPGAALGVDGAVPAAELAGGRFGIVRLPALITQRTGGEALGKAYEAALRTGLVQMDRAPLCGWIVDLRQDGGGNMWPMLTGLDPLLGDAPFGYFVASGLPPMPWGRADGAVKPAFGAVQDARPAFALTHRAAPVAVLIGPGTGSSGEMTAVALIGRARVRTFGAASAGLTTANSAYPLSDGAVLVITESAIRDRTGHDYSGSIQPDEPASPYGAEQAAEHWLAASCAS